MAWIFPLILLIVFEAVADIFSKEYSLRYHWLLWLAALGSYSIANIFWLSAIRNGSGLAKGAVLFSVGSAIVALFIGIGFYQEEASGLQVVGMVMGIAAAVLILSGGK